MSAGVVYIVVTGDWTEPDGDDTPTGAVLFDLTAALVSPSNVTPKTVRSFLSQGVIAQQLVANDFDTLGQPTNPSTTQYRVQERLLGSPQQDYYVTIPAVPPGSRTLNDGVTVTASQLLTSDAANFTDDDENLYVWFPNGSLPVGVQIADVIDEHTVRLTAASSLVGTGVTFMVGAQAALSQLRSV